MKIPKPNIAWLDKLYYLGDNVFWVIITLIVSAVLFSAFVFYTSVFLVERAEITETSTQLQVNQTLFNEVKTTWQERKKIFDGDPPATLRNIFK